MKTGRKLSYFLILFYAASLAPVTVPASYAQSKDPYSNVDFMGGAGNRGKRSYKGIEPSKQRGAGPEAWSEDSPQFSGMPEPVPGNPALPPVPASGAAQPMGDANLPPAPALPPGQPMTAGNTPSYTPSPVERARPVQTPVAEAAPVQRPALNPDARTYAAEASPAPAAQYTAGGETQPASGSSYREYLQQRLAAARATPPQKKKEPSRFSRFFGAKTPEPPGVVEGPSMGGQKWEFVHSPTGPGKWEKARQ